MSPYETRPIPRQPLAALPIEPFLVRVNSSTSPRKPKPTLPLQLRDMSLLPSPFLTASTSAAAIAVQQRPEPRPLATLYEAAPSRDASSGPKSSPKARLMMQEDDTQDLGSNTNATERADGDDDDDEQEALALGSSPRRLYDAFVAVAHRPAAAARASPRPRKKTSTSSLSAAHFVAERSHMPPPPSPRRTGSPRIARAILRADDEPPPNWSFYQDDEEESGDVSMSSVTANDGPVASLAGSSADIDSSEHAMPIDKENTAPLRPEARSRSSSLLATLTNPTVAPAPGAPPASVPPSTTPTRPPPTSTLSAAAAPCTPPRPISPPLPLLSPPLLAAVEAPSVFGDTDATSFFVRDQLGSTDLDLAGQETALLPPTMDTDGIDEAPRKKRRSDEAGRSISID